MKNENEVKESGDRRDDPRLSAYVLDELAMDEREALERELAADAVLVDEVRALEGLSAGLREALGESAAPQLDESRRAEILRAARKPVVRREPRYALRLAAAASLLVLGGSAWWAMRMHSSAERVAKGPFTYSIYGDVHEAAAPAASAPAASDKLRGLGYIGGDDSETRALDALGYGGKPANVPGPLTPGMTPFQGGSGRTYTWRDSRYARENALGTESYDSIRESVFHEPLREPLSTFSIDVDTASYANVRRFLSQRSLPPADAVRIEELVNYFRYDYPEPRGTTPFSVSVDSASAPWAPEHRLVRIGLAGRAPDLETPRVKNLVFLVDVSGSMDDPAKLPLVQRSLRLLVNELGDEDRVALVVYAGNSGLVLPATPARERARILDAIDALKAGGSTNGGSGIQLAYSIALEHFAKDGINRVVLATDGDFNVGVTDRAELLRLIEAKAKSGVYLSVLGFGTGNLKDATMEQLADHGNGNYAYVDSLAEARKVLVREMGATLETIAKDVKIQVEFNPAQVGAWRLVGYENRQLAARDFNDDKKDAGEIGAGHMVTALYEIVPVGGVTAGVDSLRYSTPVEAPTQRSSAGASGELLTVKLRYKQPDSDTSQLLTVPFTDEGRSFESAAPDFRFAASVAAFGLCLRGSSERGNATLTDVYRWAEPALGADPHGDRREFLRLVDTAAGLSGR